MKVQFPSLFFILYRRLILSLNYGRIVRVRGVGRFLAWAFANAVRCRRYFASPAYRAKSVVVSIGNIVLGGAGKTPSVLWLFHLLQKQGVSCAVLSRGYKSQCYKKKHYSIVDIDCHDVKYVGDEPLLMAKQLPKQSVWVHKNRQWLAQEASERHDVLILDDGLQYTRLHKDIEIAVVNGRDPLGGGEFFPKGRLRDFPDQLRKVDYVIVNGPCGQEEEGLLSRHCPAPKIFVRPVITKVTWDVGDQAVRDLRGMGVGVFCGLGFPQGFLAMLKEAGLHVLGTYVLPDHVAITKKELYYFCKSIALRKGIAVLCTEKDRVKLPLMEEDFLDLPIGTVHMTFSVDRGEEHISTLLESIRGKIQTR